jgi:hypothetical protein
MGKPYMIAVGLKGDSLRIEADDQIEAMRLAQNAILEDGLLIYVQRMDKGEPAEDEALERTTAIWRPGHEGSPVLGSRRYSECGVRKPTR